MQRKSRGRPTKLTRELQDAFVGHIRAGNYIETSAALCGINKDSVYEWLKRGKRAKSGVYREFSDAVTKADAEFEDRMLSMIEACAPKDWKAAAWRLEHRKPRRYKQKQHIEHTGKRGGPIETRELSQLSDEQLEAIARGEK